MTLFDKLKQDLRYVEGLKSCINCGVCTAICPAARVYEYSPRNMMNRVQQFNEETLRELLQQDTIWLCGECLSCKTRCPKGNTPGYVIQALRALSIETGDYAQSKQGQKQLALKRTIGEHILKYGYCVYIDEVNTEMFPEQGPVWEWLRNNRHAVLNRLGVSYQKVKSGALRQISQDDLNDLQRIFDETGATERFEKFEAMSAEKSKEMGLDDTAYFNYLYND